MATVEIFVTLKPALLDVQGTTVRKALHQLGHTNVRDVRIGKFITLEVDDATSPAALQEQLDKMCQQLLANPVIENYEITLPAPPTVPAVPEAAPGPLPVTAATTATATTVLSPAAEPVRTLPGTTAPVATVPPPSALSVSEQLATAQIGASTAATPEPFTMDYDSYAALPAAERLALHELAWQKHGAWIQQELARHRAAWILVVDGAVVESGATLDSYPSEARQDQLGTTNQRVPWVFVKPA